MEVKIIVSDGEGATGAPGATVIGAAPSAQPWAMAAPAAAPDYGATQASGAATPPEEILRAAAALGAINGGPAPSFGNMGQAGTPPPFITGNVGPMAAALGRGPDVAAGAAPGSGAQMETFTAPEPGGAE